MHTTVEMVHRDDVENVIKPIYETLLKIENNESFSYFHNCSNNSDDTIMIILKSKLTRIIILSKKSIMSWCFFLF
jgi:hypothetical protein